MNKLLTKKELTNGTKVRVRLDNNNYILGKICGVATIDLFLGFQNFIIEAKDEFPNETYPYKCFCAINSQIELVEEENRNGYVGGEMVKKMIEALNSDNQPPLNLL